MIESDKVFGLKEDAVSMFLGLFIVVIVLFLLFNYFRKKSGRIDLGGLTDVNPAEESVSIEDSDSGGGDYYTVVKGDSLWKIAERKYGNGNAWTDLASVNGLATADFLLVGQKIKLPDLDFEGDLANISEYVVEKNDSLSKIALRAYGDMFAWEKIWEANKDTISNPNLIEIGMTLSIPR
ncbi:LysM peptidoglycan-binding domain-containing protein [Patescibacteria group bacterium]|nr:LysM peptidoglycan-binding domain-containing protein [Patescibacteria group bacterium]MCG2701782.1 LysM peptidoglycan-binding domain-containing protein [Candidatus Parcubacteria bacterium]MBU4264686.1 LysM peptidoglycan-binding domain-containing protein [Patescibacteria group bacterium]MBU4390641.1 LysM peptidoglycan-binding domain-containing protein [Patescibacteria group bacterium]MBU4431037.1 LysM peptidoglycan-binding domain-containing protein [Patescibacteria group bacterium]